MKGINYLTDENQKIIAVQIDLKTNQQLWEDLQDYIIADAAKNAKKTKLVDFKKELKREGKLK